MSIDIKLLENLLSGPLPGEPAQKEMMARAESPLRFAQSARVNARESAVLILLFKHEGRLGFPLILRHDYEGAHSGQVSLPGGRKEPVDTDLIATALRESEEEIGVDRSKITVLGQLTSLFIPVSNFIVYPVVGYMNETPVLVPEEREVKEILFASVDDLFFEDNIKRTTLNIRGIKLDTPYFDIGGSVVWGATAMILSEFRKLMLKTSNNAFDI